jgi:hypothetical protein
MDKVKQMKLKITIILLSILLVTGGCVTKFIPEITDEKDLMVVEGMITDRLATYTIKLSMSQPLGKITTKNPLTGANVTVSDDAGHLYYFMEKKQGLYQSDSTVFQGEIGRKYTLHVKTNTAITNDYSYQSYPVELKAVPPIDSIYFEKVEIGTNEWGRKIEGCQIYLDTRDNGEDCQYFRWGYSETWEFRLPFEVPNKTCWRSENSYEINLKSTASLAENRIEKFPLHFVDNTSDRLTVEYSMLVKQYSVTQDEYDYWSKVKNVTQNVGGLYDIVPASVIGNVFCNDDPAQAVLGYFSVSAESVKRVFVKDNFAGQANYYTQCIADTVGPGPIDGLGIYVWVVYSNFMPPYQVITYNKNCADCTTRGTNIKPDYWDNKKNATK